MSAERSGARVDIWVMVLPTLLLATGVALVFVLRAVTILALRPADKRAQHLHDKLRRACVKGGEAKGRTLSTMIVLGSGGHTAEMLRLVGAMDKQKYTPRTYVVAATDRLSAEKAVRLEGDRKDYTLEVIHRSREVGQSWLSTPGSTLRAIVHAMWLIFGAPPQVLLCNGPGTCIPLCLAAFFARALFVGETVIVYIESIARVQKLSLSGQILYTTRLADLMLVQWEGLQAAHPRTQYAGRLM
mmetsp:Transcript_1684/g.5909  ORF Transcript_1684/g.5909 Transcript_1684/m.5909 type:complete len:243 (-) Transcript_1684:1814-2542(-)